MQNKLSVIGLTNKRLLDMIAFHYVNTPMQNSTSLYDA